jgi:predicted transposase YdaD
LLEARIAGLKEGREEGREQGRAEGRAEGREQGRAEERLENARNLKENGVPVDVIAKSLRLTQEEVSML